MIKNQKQAKATERKLNQLIQDRDIYQKNNEVQAGSAKYRLALNGFNGLIQDLEAQLQQYQDLTEGNFNLVNPNLHNFSEALIAARIAQKISHETLAERTGLLEQQIQRYEATDYEGAKHSRMVDIAIALGLNCNFEGTWVMNQDKHITFDLPTGVSQQEIDELTQKVKLNGSILIQ